MSVPLTIQARGISKGIDICEIYRKGLGEERDVEADDWNAQERGGPSWRVASQLLREEATCSGTE